MYKNIEDHREYCRAYFKKNREYLLKCRKENYLAHKEERLAKSKEYHNKRMKIDPNFKLRVNLRTRLRIALRDNQKVGSAIRDLGCTVEELKSHLESKFTDGMNWENHGKWHIDHIKPLSLFNLVDREELREAVNWRNLQPMWAIDNVKKGNKVALLI